MTLEQVILNCLDHEVDEYKIYQVYAKRHGGSFMAQSEAIVLALTEEEIELKTKDLAALKCPGFDYFLELDMIQDFYHDIQSLEEFDTDEKRVKRVIYYAEFDA